MINGTHSPQKHYRRSIRLKGYDYSQPGAYFVTICSYDRKPIFGEILDAEMILSRYGRIVLTDWQNLPKHHPCMESGAFVVMPNHIYGIVVIKDTATGLRAASGIAKQSSLPEIIRGFKTFSTRRISRARHTVGSVWQRNYWEHVIRDQDSFGRIHDYILTNPLRWHLDRENFHREGEDDFDRWLDSL